MKSKLLSLILILAVAATAATGVTILYDEVAGIEASIAVISDLHIVSEEYYTNSHTYYEYASEEKLIHLSEAMLKTVVDDLNANKKIKTVLVTGDITENGDIASQYAAARILQKLVDAGKQVFIINGNHDGLKRTEHTGVRADANMLREIYHEFGYKQAIVKDTRSLSYVADINAKYRVIAIDNDDYLSPDIDGPKEEIDDELIAWVEEQLVQCAKDGKTPLAIAHKPLASHMPLLIGEMMGLDDVKDSFRELAAALADNGCRYLFTGHLHGQDIASYVSPEGNRLLDIETSSLLFVPNAYRMVEFTPREVRITSKRFDKINMDYVPPFNTAADYNLMKEDFTAYSLAHFGKSMKTKVMGSLSASELQSMFGFSQDMAPVVDLLANNVIHDLFTTPLYGSGSSLNKIVTDYGGAPLPQTGYEDLLDIAAFFVRTIDSGDENLRADMPELVILKQGIKAIFYFLETNKEAFAEYYPGMADVNIDLDRLFGQGELEVIDSGIIDFILELLADKLPNEISSLNFSNLTAIKLFGRAFLNVTQSGLGDKLAEGIGQKHFDLDIIIDNVLFGVLLSDALTDVVPGDNNVIIDRDTLSEKA